MDDSARARADLDSFIARFTPEIAARIRNIQLPTASVLGSRDVRALIARAIAGSPRTFDRTRPLQTVIRAVVPHQRPRRPGVPAGRTK